MTERVAGQYSDRLLEAVGRAETAPECCPTTSPGCRCQLPVPWPSGAAFSDGGPRMWIAPLPTRALLAGQQNRALLRYPGRATGGEAPSRTLIWQREASIALVDTQPGAGNNPLPRPGSGVWDSSCSRPPHLGQRSRRPWRPTPDVRPGDGADPEHSRPSISRRPVYGPATPPLATALCCTAYWSDALGLSLRSAGAADAAAYFYLPAQH